jgi:hypothetical protein
MYLELAAAGYLLGDFIYHRIKGPDIEPIPPQEFRIPLTEEGATVPLIYGRCRVRTPELAWCGTPEVEAGDITNGYPETSFVYKLDMFFKLGIGFDDGAGANTFRGAWNGEERFTFLGSAKETPAQIEIDSGSTFGADGVMGGFVEWYDGNAAQEHVDSGGSAATALGVEMLAAGVPAEEVSGFRGYISAFLHNSGGTHWYVGSSPSVAAYSFEVSSYPVTAYPAPWTQVGQDANPVDVIWDVCKSYFSKLGIPTTLLDFDSFTAAATTLHQESHGYSRCIDDVRSGSEIIQEILRQIDGVMYVDPDDGKVKIRLIRNDYDPADLLHITKDNCDDITNFAIGGWTGLPNAVRVSYTNRSDDYRNGSVVAKSSANAVGQDGVVRWKSKQFPGITHEALAYNVAWRELGWESRPQMKCTALLSRQQFRSLTPGQAVKVSWKGPDISNVIFRVARVSRGKVGNGKIVVDLIQSPEYVYRNSPPQPPGLDHPDVGEGIDIGFGG